MPLNERTSFRRILVVMLLEGVGGGFRWAVVGRSAHAADATTSGPSLSGEVGHVYGYPYTTDGDSGVSYAVTAESLPPACRCPPAAL